MSSRRGVVGFLLLAVALSWWPWLGRLDNPEAAVVLPFGPSLAALALLAGARRRSERHALLRSLHPRGIGRAWIAVVIPPGVGALVVLLALALGNHPDVDGAETALAILLSTPLIAVVAGPLGEELGWRGFLLPRLLRRRTPVVASTLVAGAWLLWHLPLIITDPARYGIPWAVVLVSTSAVMTVLHLWTGGNVLLAVVFHAVVNSATAAAVQLLEPEGRPLAWWLAAALWAALGGAAAAALPSRQTESMNHTPHLISQTGVQK